MTEKVAKTVAQELKEQIENQAKQITALTSQLSELNLKEAKAAETHVHQPSVTPLPSQPPSPKPQESGLEHYRNCPTCHKAINEEAKKELEPEIVKSMREKVKSMKEPTVCLGCGEIVERSEPKCPSCGNSKGKRL